MLLAQENLEGVEVTLKYATCPKELLEIVMGNQLLFLFTWCSFIHLTTVLFYVHQRSV